MLVYGRGYHPFVLRIQDKQTSLGHTEESFRKTAGLTLLVQLVGSFHPQGASGSPVAVTNSQPIWPTLQGTITWDPPNGKLGKSSTQKYQTGSGGVSSQEGILRSFDLGPFITRLRVMFFISIAQSTSHFKTGFAILGGGWTNPFETSKKSKIYKDHFTWDRGKNKKHISSQHLEKFY